MERKVKPLTYCHIYIVGIQKRFSQSKEGHFLRDPLPGTNHICSPGCASNILFTKSRILSGIRRPNEFGAVTPFQENALPITVTDIFSIANKNAHNISVM